MARTHEDRTFPIEQEAEARQYAADYLAAYSGPWNPYAGTATVLPPNEDRPRWLVMASRNSSAD